MEQKQVISLKEEQERIGNEVLRELRTFVSRVHDYNPATDGQYPDHYAFTREFQVCVGIKEHDGYAEVIFGQCSTMARSKGRLHGMSTTDIKKWFTSLLHGLVRDNFQRYTVIDILGGGGSFGYRVLAEPCKEYGHLCDALAKATNGSFRLKPTDCYKTYLFGKRSHYSEHDRTQRNYLFANAASCMRMIGKIKTLMDNGARISGARLEEYDDIDTSISSKLETECHGQRTVMVVLPYEYNGVKDEEYLFW